MNSARSTNPSMAAPCDAVADVTGGFELHGWSLAPPCLLATHERGVRGDVATGEGSQEVSVHGCNRRAGDVRNEDPADRRVESTRVANGRSRHQLGTRCRRRRRSGRSRSPGRSPRSGCRCQSRRCRQTEAVPPGTVTEAAICCDTGRALQVARIRRVSFQSALMMTVPVAAISATTAEAAPLLVVVQDVETAPALLRHREPHRGAVRDRVPGGVRDLRRDRVARGRHARPWRGGRPSRSRS